MDVWKNDCDGERQIFFWNEEGIKSFLCETIGISLNYQEVCIYLNYSTPHPICKLVKM